MRTSVQRILIVLAAVCSLYPVEWTAGPCMARAEQEDPTPSKFPDFSGSFLTFFLWKNDRDFDRREPLFDEYGQSMGYTEVTFYPKITWQVHDTIRFHYFAEIGDSVWSRTDVDARSETAQNKPVVRHKEFWTEIMLPWEETGVRVGFQDIRDPTQLVLKKYVGALHGFYRTDERAWRLTLLQIPDTTFEGITFEENNFANDNFVFLFDADLSPDDGTRIRPGLLLQWDRTDVDRDEILANACLNLRRSVGHTGFLELDLVLQAGRGESRSIHNRDMDVLAGALQVRGGLESDTLSIEGNLVAFSPDDGDPYNGRDTAFRYSGYCKSRTLLLSENRLFDQFDNLDERAAGSGAGLLIADLYTGTDLTKGPALFAVVGYGTVLEGRYANGGRTIGVETDAGIVWRPYSHTKLTALGGALVPGRAGGAFVNELGSLRGEDPMYFFQAALEVSF